MVGTGIRVFFRVCLVSILRRRFEASGGDKNPDSHCVADYSRFSCHQQSRVAAPQRKRDAFLVSDLREGDAALSERLKRKCTLNTGKTDAV
jgi:hypothetical protein